MNTGMLPDILNLEETQQYLSDTMLTTTISGLELITELSCQLLLLA